MALGIGIGRVWPTLVLTLIAVTATMARHKDGLHVVNMVCGVLANLANGDGRCTAAVTKAPTLPLTPNPEPRALTLTPKPNPNPNS